MIDLQRDEAGAMQRHFYAVLNQSYNSLSPNLYLQTSSLKCAMLMYIYRFLLNTRSKDFFHKHFIIIKSHKDAKLA